MEIKEFCQSLKALAARALLIALVGSVVSEASYATLLMGGWADLEHPGLRSIVINHIKTFLSILPGDMDIHLLPTAALLTWIAILITLITLTRKLVQHVMGGLEWSTMEYHRVLSPPRKLIRALDGYAYDIEEVHQRFFGQITAAKQAIAARKEAARQERERDLVSLDGSSDDGAGTIPTQTTNTADAEVQVGRHDLVALHRNNTLGVLDRIDAVMEATQDNLANVLGDEAVGQEITVEMMAMQAVAARGALEDARERAIDEIDYLRDLAEFDPVVYEDREPPDIEPIGAGTQTSPIRAQPPAEFGEFVAVDVDPGTPGNPLPITEVDQDTWEFEHPRLACSIKAREHLALAICAELKSRKAPVIYRAQPGLDMILNAEANIIYKELRQKAWFTDVRRFDWAEAVNLAITLYKIPTVSECAVMALERDEAVQRRKRYSVESIYYWIEDFFTAVFFMEREHRGENEPLRL